MNSEAKHYRGFTVEFRVGSGRTWILCNECGRSWSIEPGPLSEVLGDLEHGHEAWTDTDE